jgi:hypothetical protein
VLATSRRLSVSEAQVRSWLGSVPTDDIDVAYRLVLASARRMDVARSPEIVGGEFLTPPEWQTPLGDSDYRHVFGTSEAPPPQDTSVGWVRVLLGSASDEEYLAAFPARTKSDLSVRRERMGTIAHAWRVDSVAWREMVTEAREWRWDYVWAMNMFTQAFLCRKDDWWRKAHRIGLLPASIDDYIVRAKQLTALLKTRRSSLPLTQWAEVAGLTGYRQPPMPGFDLLEEAKSLAGGGETDGIGAPKASFRDVLPEALAMQVPFVPFEDLESYIRSGRWATGGASSVGRVEVEYVADGEEKSFKFKASKAQVREIMTDEEIIDYVKTHTAQVNVAIVKAELAKLRIAVSGDLATYLRMAWLTERLGGAYAQWTGSTTEEGFIQQTDRLISMLAALKGRWGLPFDFKGFDHQPTTDEIIAIVEWLFNGMRQNVPATRRAEVEAQMAIVLEGFRHAMLVVRTDDGVEELDVEGGLMSGLRWTTIIGNAWNSVVTLCVIKNLEAMGVRGAVLARWIRGDDSALVCPTWVDASIVAHAFSWVGAIGGAGKFSIWPENFEFLRQQIGPDVSAYGVRLVAGYNQRKPWTSEPWQPFATLTAQAEVRDSLVRRGYDRDAVWALWRETVTVVSRRKRLSRRWIALPREMGGLGLERWDGWVPDRPLPRAQLPDLRIANSVGRTLKRVEAIAAQINPAYSKHEAETIARDELRGTLLSNSRPEVLRLLVDPPFSATWHRTPVVAAKAVWTEGPVLQIMQPFAGVADAVLDVRSELWGAGRAAVEKWREWALVERATGVKPIDLLRRFYPAYAIWLAKLERRGMRRRDALAWLFGETQFELNGVNPTCSPLVGAAARSMLGDVTKGQWRGTWQKTVHIYSVHASSMLSHSRWYKTLYRW